MGGQEIFCARASESAQEPLAGTASQGVRHYLLIEDQGPWGPKAPNGFALLDAKTQAGLREIQKLPGLKVIYLRRPRNPVTMPQDPRRMWLASMPHPLQGELGGVRELERQPIAQFVAQVQQDGLEAMARHAQAGPEQMWLVCTHGQRDRCCSLYGMGLFSGLEQALAQAGLSQVQCWQSSHLGGHRFAATAVHLPSGYMWGRLRAEDAPALLEVSTRGQLPLPDKLRGHVGLDAPAQVADLLARRHGHGTGLCPDPALWEAQDRRFELSGASIEVEQGPLLQVQGSCGEEATKSRQVWTAKLR